MLLTHRSEQQQVAASAFRQPVQPPRPHQQVSTCPPFQQHALAGRLVQHPPPCPCRHCGGSHWDADCSKTAKFLACLNSTVAAHHVDAIEYSEADYAKLEYRYLKASQASHSAELSDIDDVPGMMHFPDALDTSSSVLLIDDAALKLFWHKLTPSDLVIWTASTPTCATFVLHVPCQEQAVAHMNVQCYIIDNLPSHIILGMDFVLRHGILYNAVKGFITLQSCSLCTKVLSWVAKIDPEPDPIVAHMSALPLLNIIAPDMRALPDYITTFDLHKALYQMPLHPDGHWKATVLTHHGQETLSCTIMGQSHSVAFLQRVLTDASKVAGLSNGAFVYVNEFGVCLDMLDEHAKHICAILNIIQGLSLTLAQDKTHVARKEVPLLWHLVSGQGTCTMPSKCEAIQLIPYPSMLNQLKHVIGFFSYYKNYVLQFSVLIAPLQCLETTLLRPLLKTGHACKSYRTGTLAPDDSSARQSLTELYSSQATLSRFC
ncbi:uncharacterized protein UBRO_20925 [Ustilago bromivora]|uniref:Reverse transcriptase domain-containing protein n=1 Tax=Ustilago bromivora TaxID=307758 RepID=A0A1K0GXF7_9BASI|nr:uncharacterized protein UBRO_20925 [Ustilago bromivora]